MKKLLVLLLKFSLPLLLLLAVYACLDPFKVLWHYDSFYEPDTKVSITLNKDYVSTTTYDNQYKTAHYNSFIFGNSRSVFYETAQWEKYLDGNNKPYHFDASAETLYGICKKIEYIDGKEEKMDNVLLVLDHMILSRDKPLDGHLFVISPQLTGYSNYGEFQIQFLRAFLSYKFLPGYIEYKVTGKVKPYMIEATLDTEAFMYNSYTNEMRHTTSENEIANGTFYTPELMEVFYSRDTIQKHSPVVIKDNQKALLTEIARILKKQGTNFRIIINPLYDQEKLNTADLAYLQKLFGKEAVFDFSGINDITNDYRNYYESSHYRPQAANKVLTEIYGK